MSRDEALVVQRGTVVETGDGQCTIRLEARSCAACRGACGAALSLTRTGPARVDVPYGSMLHSTHGSLQQGATVWVGVPRAALTRLVLVTFGIPLLVLLSSAGIAEWAYGLPSTFDAAARAVPWAVIALAMTLAGVHRFIRRTGHDRALRLRMVDTAGQA